MSAISTTLAGRARRWLRKRCAGGSSRETPEPLPASTALAAATAPMASLEAECEATQRLLRETPDIIALHTPEGRILSVSAACHRILGYAPEDMIGRLYFDFLHPDEVFRSKRRQDVAVQRLGEHVASYRVRRADGSYVWLETVTRVLPDPATGLAGDVVMASRALSGRDSEQRALRRSEVLYRRTFDEAAIPGCLIEAGSGQFLRVNGAFCRLVGYSRAELRELNSRELIHPGDLGPTLEALRAAVANARGHLGMTARLLCKDGSSVATDADFVLLHDDQGQPLYFICQMRPHASLADPA